MSKIRTIGIKIVCNHCGEDYRTTEGFVSYNGDENGSQILMDAETNDWIEIGSEHFCPDCYTIEQFAEDHPDGVYVVGTGEHVVTVMNGQILDAWDSSDEIPVYYWLKEE